MHSALATEWDFVSKKIKNNGSVTWISGKCQAFSVGAGMDDKGDPSNEEAPKAIKPTSKEFRKTGRQPKRTERVEQFLTIARRRGRRNTAVSPEDSGEPTSCPATDAETASEGSVESASEIRSGSQSAPTTVTDKASSEKAKGGDDEDDTSDSDSDGLTLKELQNRLRRKREQEPTERPLKGIQSRLGKKRREEGPAATMGSETGDAVEGVLPSKQEPENDEGVASQTGKHERETKLEGKAAQGIKDEEPADMGRLKPECEGYDPNALYCICRQPHNNRFMICCDRCEEWFHGDCVGISEARGRLLERNGEDYICPNCTILQVQDETNSETTDEQETKFRPGDADGTDCTSIGTIEQKCSEDQGIKGRIEKAANPSGKKKLKIFQPVIEVPGASKCIGPGCCHVAQPDSVYCSNDCILKHAAATMKFLSSGKDQKPKPKEKMKMKAEKPSVLKCSFQAGIKISSVHKRPAPEKKETTVKKAPPRKTGGPRRERQPPGKQPLRAPRRASSLRRETSCQRSPLLLMWQRPNQPLKKSPSGFKGTIPKRSWLSAAPSSGASAARQAGPAPAVATAASKKFPGSAALVGAVRKPVVPSVPTASPAPGRLGAMGAAPSQPNSQIRQNIRRSLKEILWKRVSDSDDLIMTENEVGKIALHIEKEMFNLFHVTDSRYKSKYRSIMFNLKDPKNQGLFHRVLREEISLAKLVRMKPEELVSKELSTWKEKPTRSVMEPRTKMHSESRKAAARQEIIPDMEDSPPVSDSEEQQESARAVPEKSAAPLLDVFSSMLKDTTSQHRAHLFDLNCKICTGQVPSAEDEPAPKKLKLSASVKKEDLKPKHESSVPDPAPDSADEVIPEALPAVAPQPGLESASHPNVDRTYFPGPPGDGRPEPSPLEDLSPCPASCGSGVVTTVTVSGRDPRTAPSSSCTAVASTAARPDSTHVVETRQDVPKPALTSVMVPKSILAKPSSSPDPRYLSVPPSPNTSTSESRSPPEGDTTLFLSRLSTIWKGFINMQSVAKFVTKAYPVSGCFDYLSEDLPDTIHIGGRIAPKTVWDYVGKLKSSVSKELCLIRFHPATEEEEVAYISLYSYFSSRGRFGVVANNNRHVKDLYLIPLSAQDPVPSKLLPFEGPGLESPRPNIILGLVICQKMKRPANTGELDKMDEKRIRLQQEEVDVPAYPKVSTAPQSDRKPSRYQLYAADMAVGTTPPGSPPPPPPLPEPPVLRVLSSLKPAASSPATAVTTTAVAPTATPPTAPPASKTASPLEHILQTLFGKKKSFDPSARDPAGPTAGLHQDPKTTAEDGVPAPPLLDPIVQQFGQFSKDKAPEEEEDDRPYDPEEEYDPERAFDAQPVERGQRHEVERAPEAAAAEREEVAYDPEDETILEEAKVTVDDLPNRMCADVRRNSTERPAEQVAGAATPSLVEQQKMLEELNKQIEEQKRQLEEQEEALRQQRAAVGVSMAHFSVSDALMSPPPKSSLPKAELFQQEQQPADKPASLTPASQVANQRDPRQARRLAADSGEGEGDPLSRLSAWGAQGTLPTRDVSRCTLVGQALMPVPEEKELASSPWASGEKPPAGPEQDGWKAEAGEGARPAMAGDSSARPARRVLLPTPPCGALQPGFPLQHDGERDPFSSLGFAAQDKALSSAQYEDPRNLHSGRSGSPAGEAEGDREPQARPGEGTTPLPLPGQKVGCSQPQFQGQREPGPHALGMSGLHGPNFTGPRGPVPPFPEENIASNDGPRGPPPARFGAQKGPIPSLFLGQHGPPPYGDGRGPSPSYLGGPRGVPPSQFEERKDPHGEKREFQDTPYNEVTGAPTQFEGTEQAPFLGSRGGPPFQFGGQRRPLLPQLKGPRGGPPPSQFGGQRGPPPGHFVGPRGPHPSQFETARGPHPSQFEGPRGQAPNLMPGPRGIQPQQLEDQRVHSPPRFTNQRAPAPMQFGGPRGSAPFPEKNEQTPSRFHFPGQAPQVQVMKPGPRPLLELPSHPPQHRKDRWEEAGAPPALSSSAPGQGPEADGQWAPPDFREGKGHEYRNQTFDGRQRERFDAGPKEKPLEDPDGQGRAGEDRRRERERGRNWSRERDWERARDWDRQRDKDSGRDWDRNRERSAHRDRGREAERGKDWERSRNRERERERRRDRDRSRSRERERDRDRARDRERGRDRDRKDRTEAQNHRGSLHCSEGVSWGGSEPQSPSPSGLQQNVYPLTAGHGLLVRWISGKCQAFSVGAGMDDKGDPSNEEAPKAIKPTSKEFRKTWGFRRTTVAKREGAGDADADPLEPPPPQQQLGLSLRRSGRQPKRTERVEQFLTIARRRGRRNTAVSPEDSGEPTSCPATDAETASEGSVESASEIRSGSQSAPTAVTDKASSQKAKGGHDEDDTSISDSDGLTSKELQNRLCRKREQEPTERPLKGIQSRLGKKRREEGPAATMGSETGDAVEGVLPSKQEPENDEGVASQTGKHERETKLEGKAAQGIKDEEPADTGRLKPECEGYDPNALCCVCRQPHNNRFMICCDRCEEWFHGDCVGISEARGRLLERNGEDYICPNCTILQVQNETNSETTDEQETKFRPGDADGTDCTSTGTIEQKCSEAQGIKRRIEKAANPSGKKKLKIFQPPDSVYCSNDCILKHAAATMKFLSSGKDRKPKPKEKMKMKAEKPSLLKCSFQAGIKISSVHKRPAPEKKETTVKKAVAAPARSEALGKEAACESSTPSWASDHNYNAVKPGRTAAPSPALLYKSAKEDRRSEERAAASRKTAPPGSTPGKQPAPRNLVPKKPSFANVAAAKPAIKKSPSGFKGTIPKRSWLSAAPSSGASAARQAGPAPAVATAASKKFPGSAALVGAVRKPVVPSVPTASPAPGRLGAMGAAPSQPNSQIRQNIRRSLKEILWKRVSDSDDLIMTENKVGKIALHIEKEMFNLFHVTDSRYKSKYRSITFNLKDPKNQVMEPRTKRHSESRKAAARQEIIPDMDDSPPVSDSEEQQESARAVPEKSAAPLLDVFSSVLKDTTSQHRAHLFDLNCKICTGQVPSAEDEPAPKKLKLSASVKKEDLKPKHESSVPDPAPDSADEVIPEALPAVAPQPGLESASHPNVDRTYFPGPPGDGRPEPSPLEDLSPCPASCGSGVVTTVTVSGRDPRTAPRSSCTAVASTAARPDSTHVVETRQDVPKPALTSVMVPKSILVKPSSSPDPRYLSVPPSRNTGTSESWSPPEGDTTLFLSRLSTIWKGFINMQSVAKFVTKAYPVSGCFNYLSEDLPDTIHIGGRIAPKTVWDYVGKLKSSVSKELCLIRFHPATEEEEVAYISLYYYFSSRGRFGVVTNNNRHVKDLYLIPLSAQDPVPSKLLPFEGPGPSASTLQAACTACSAGLKETWHSSLELRVRFGALTWERTESIPWRC
ncbi:Death-inducer obliterator 1 [Plecturocebus cupreus]